MPGTNGSSAVAGRQVPASSTTRVFVTPSAVPSSGVTPTSEVLFPSPPTGSAVAPGATAAVFRSSPVCDASNVPVSVTCAVAPTGIAAPW